MPLPQQTPEEAARAAYQAAFGWARPPPAFIDLTATMKTTKARARKAPPDPANRRAPPPLSLHTGEERRGAQEPGSERARSRRTEKPHPHPHPAPPEQPTTPASAGAPPAGGPLEFPAPEPGPGSSSPSAPEKKRKRERRGFCLAYSVSEAVAVASLARIAGGYERRKQQLEDSPD